MLRYIHTNGKEHIPTIAERLEAYLQDSDSYETNLLSYEDFCSRYLGYAYYEYPVYWKEDKLERLTRILNKKIW